MKLWEMLTKGEERLREAKIAEYKNDALELLLYLLKKDRAYYLMNKNEDASEELTKEYDGAINKRASRIPLQHITGSQCFMGLDFTVNEHVLTPRYDTEILVDKVLKYIKTKDSNMTLLDMCTGSGCIAISLEKLSNKELKVTAADISDKALELAKKNADNLNSKVSFIKSDLFGSISGQYDIIVSNPPYIRSDEIKNLMPEVREHEPWLALDGSGDGLLFYRKILESAPHFQERGGAIFFEIGYDQGEEVSALMEAAGYRDIEVIKDYAGLDRVVWGQIK